MRAVAAVPAAVPASRQLAMAKRKSAARPVAEAEGKLRSRGRSTKRQRDDDKREVRASADTSAVGPAPRTEKSEAVKGARCPWAESGTGDVRLQYIQYHDDEWGRPVHDDTRLFEMLVLEGAQAGLSWSTILRKRCAYREAFCCFDPEQVANFDEAKVEALLGPESGIVKHRGKVLSAISNAKLVLEAQKEFGSFSNFIWNFVPDGKPIVNRWSAMNEVPATTKESEAMSRTLKERGFKFVGPTICYAFMQAVGLVNDHLVSCPYYKEIANTTK